MGKSKAIKPTRDQKAVIVAAGLIWSDWLVLSESDEELHIISRGDGISSTLKKPLRVGKPSQRHQVKIQYKYNRSCRKRQAKTGGFSLPLRLDLGH